MSPILVHCFKFINGLNTVTWPQVTRTPLLTLFRSLTLHCVAAIDIYSTSGDPRTNGYCPMSSPPPSPTATLVNVPHRDERPAVKLKISCGGSNILNSIVFDAAGQPLYTVSSNSNRTTFVACQNNDEVATVQWDHSSPRMVFRGKKIKCKNWLPLGGPGIEYKPRSVYCLRSF